MAEGPTDIDQELRFIVVRYEDTWHLAPLPIRDPRPISTGEIIEQMRLGTQGPGEIPDRLATPAANPVSPDTLLNPVWISIAEVIGDRLVVGNAQSDAPFALDEHDVGLVGLLTRPMSPNRLAEEYSLIPTDEILRRCGRLVSAGIITASAMSEPLEAPPGAEVATADHAEYQPATHATMGQSSTPSRVSDLRARAADAYRLSSKLKPVRRLVDTLAKKTRR